MNQLPKLIEELKQAKSEEHIANLRRLAIEADILALFPPQLGEAKAVYDDLTIQYKVTRAVDSEAVQNAWNALSANAQKAFKVKFDLDLKAYRAITQLDQDTAQIINHYITSKPAKPSLSLKELNV